MQTAALNSSTAQFTAQAGNDLLRRGEELAQTPVENAEEVREAFVSFFGETFFSQMIKSMRSSVGEPAYFHGGRAEEIFRGQLDQTLTEEMTEASADQFGEPLFANQFPQLAQLLKEAEANANAKQEPQAISSLDDLRALRRR